ncbi:MAG: hypothetical protein H6573_33975 [Lewinellaceae bacterium]|nr:hypothetical protein [Lewinellaceae bacterium]
MEPHFAIFSPRSPATKLKNNFVRTQIWPFSASKTKSQHALTFGLAFIAQIKYPDAFIEIDSRNKNMGWGVQINQGMGLWTHYYFREKNNRF